MLGKRVWVVAFLFKMPAAWAFVAERKETDSSKFMYSRVNSRCEAMVAFIWPRG